MDDLTLPGSIPGLLRRGSPVPHPRAADVPCVVVGVREDVARIAYPWPRNHEDVDAWPLGDLALDLTDATGRAHAAWWLADRFKLVTAGELLRVTWQYRGMWDLDGPRRRVKFWHGADSQFAVCVPALEGLVVDNDPRLLPDGSRWVDAEALRRVVLHVAGVPRG